MAEEEAREQSGEETRAKTVATKRRKTISQLSGWRGEQNVMDRAAKTRAKTAGVFTLPTSSRHQPASKEPLEKYNVCKDLKEKPTTRDRLDSS